MLLGRTSVSQGPSHCPLLPIVKLSPGPTGSAQGGSDPPCLRRRRTSIASAYPCDSPSALVIINMQPAEVKRKSLIISHLARISDMAILANLANSAPDHLSQIGRERGNEGVSRARLIAPPPVLGAPATVPLQVARTHLNPLRELLEVVIVGAPTRERRRDVDRSCRSRRAPSRSARRRFRPRHRISACGTFARTAWISYLRQSGRLPLPAAAKR